VVASLRGADDEYLTFVATTELLTPNGRLVREIMLDTGAWANFVSRSFVQKAGCQLSGTKSTVRFVNGKTATRYGILHLTISVTDSEGRAKNFQDVPFHVIDMEGFDVILGQPWLKDSTIILDPSDWTFHYRRTQPVSKCKVENPRRFSKLARGETVYALVLVDTYSSDDGEPSSPKSTHIVDGGLPSRYQDYSDVFSQEAAGKLPDGSIEHEIRLQAGAKLPPTGPIYKQSAEELRVLLEYLETMLARGLIRKSTSPVGAPILFVKKPDGTLRLCVDYRALNEITVKNRYPLPRIDEMLDRLVGAKVFSVLDLRDAYQRIRIRRGDEWLTAFRTRYGHFEYLVLPLGLCNAPATFQAYIHQAMGGLLDVFVIVYLDDILIYSQNEEEHIDHVRQVLERLRKYKLYAKLSKCHFHQKKVKFLGVIVGENGVEMDTSRIETIRDWPEPQSYREVMMFLGFTNFFRRFIYRYSKIAAPLSDLLQGHMTKETMKANFEMTPAARQAFEKLKEAFMSPPVLAHFDPDKPILLVTDASGFAYAAILLQPIGDNPSPRLSEYHPVAYMSHKMTDTQRRWEVHDQELLAIVSAFQEWRHYLEGSRLPVRVQSDHANLRYFFKAKRLNSRQARWAEHLAAFDFTIEYRPGRQNAADAPSRRPDYVPNGSQEENVGLLPTLQKKLKLGALRTSDLRSIDHLSQADQDLQGIGLPGRAPDNGETTESLVPRLLMAQVAETEDPYSSLPDAAMIKFLRHLQRRDAFANKVLLGINDGEVIESGVGPLSRWRIGGEGLLRRDESIYIPRDSAVIAELLRIHHDDPLAGHFGTARTLELLRRKYFWEKMQGDVEQYVSTCDVCQKIRAPRHKKYGKLASLPIPKEPGESLSMDFITGLPPSKLHEREFDSILVTVDRYTKMAHYLLTTSTVDAEELADLFIENVLTKYGAPKSIISDRGSLFTSQFWSELCRKLRIKRGLSTAFHPQTDGQTERQNQTLEQYLRAFVNYQQDDWASQLAIAEFAYNNSKHSSTGMSPFYALYGYNPALPTDPTETEESMNVTVEERLQKLHGARKALEVALQHAIETQAKYYDQKHKPITFTTGEKVLVSLKNIKTWGPSEKLKARFDGPFEIVEPVGKQAYRLRLPKSYGRIHPVFHVSLLEPYRQRPGEPPVPQRPDIVDGQEEWEIETILDTRLYRRRRQYLIKWKGFATYENSWVYEEDMPHAQTILREFKDRQAAGTKKAKRRRAARAT
jgi:hypothetical protein